MQRSLVIAGSLALLLAILAVAWLRSKPVPEARPGAPLGAAAAADRDPGSAPSGAAARQDEPAGREPHTAPSRPLASPTVAARRAQRVRADAIRRHLGEQRAQQAARVPAPPAALPPEPEPAPSKAEQERRAEYIRRAMREQYHPVARSCYEELLGRQPRAAGKVALAFSIVGDADAGGVVEEVELRDDSTMDDPEFVQCMRESLYSTVFEPPPPGASKTTVVYPIELRPE